MMTNKEATIGVASLVVKRRVVKGPEAAAELDVVVVVVVAA